MAAEDESAFVQALRGLPGELRVVDRVDVTVERRRLVAAVQAGAARTICRFARERAREGRKVSTSYVIAPRRCKAESPKLPFGRND